MLFAGNRKGPSEVNGQLPPPTYTLGHANSGWILSPSIFRSIYGVGIPELIKWMLFFLPSRDREFLGDLVSPPRIPCTKNSLPKPWWACLWFIHLQGLKAKVIVNVIGLTHVPESSAHGQRTHAMVTLLPALQSLPTAGSRTSVVAQTYAEFKHKELKLNKEMMI